uniref:Uncharacterized protein n=1 Tax=Mustela putorius furo TaxID=9669 RepID=M3Z4J4_MUSPF
GRQAAAGGAGCQPAQERPNCHSPPQRLSGRCPPGTVGSVPRSECGRARGFRRRPPAAEPEPRTRAQLGVTSGQEPRHRRATAFLQDPTRADPGTLRPLGLGGGPGVRGRTLRALQAPDTETPHHRPGSSERGRRRRRREDRRLHRGATRALGSSATDRAAATSVCLRGSTDSARGPKAPRANPADDSARARAAQSRLGQRRLRITATGPSRRRSAGTSSQVQVHPLLRPAELQARGKRPIEFPAFFP